MAIDKATFETRECGSDLIIEVDEPVLKVRKTLHDLKFHNKLQVDTDHVPAVLTFYELADKGGVPIADFCEGVSGTSFTLNPNGITTCVPNFYGAFEYSVTAADHEDLDPVIIIETLSSYLLSDVPGVPGPDKQLDPVAVGVALLIGLVVGALLGRRKTG